MKTLLTAAAMLAMLSLPAWAATPGQAENLFQRGQVYASQKDYAKAIDAYLQAIATDPTHERSRIALAIIYGKQKAFDKAVKELEEVQKLNPQDWLSYKVLGLIRKDQNRPAEAIAAFETYLQRVPAEKLKPQDKADVLKLVETLKSQLGQAPAAGGTP
ncbi:MAG: tetratricopeptide repeat protein [Candidatus Sericytochromatia bacterium]